MNRIKLVAALAALLACVTANAKWVEVESENFVFVGETSKLEGERIVRNLEIFRGTLLTLLGVKGTPEVRKVRVFGLQTPKHLTRETGVQGIAGIYTRADDYPVFLAALKGVDRDTGRKVTYHEFAHHIINSYTDQYIPRWYNEGFAEYIASFEAEDDIISIGRAAGDHALILRYKRWSGVDAFTKFEPGNTAPDDRAIQAVSFNLACALISKVGPWIRRTDESMTDEQREQLAEKDIVLGERWQSWRLNAS